MRNVDYVPVEEWYMEFEELQEEELGEALLVEVLLELDEEVVHTLYCVCYVVYCDWAKRVMKK